MQEERAALVAAIRAQYLKADRAATLARHATMSDHSFDKTERIKTARESAKESGILAGLAQAARLVYGESDGSAIYSEAMAMRYTHCSVCGELATYRARLPYCRAHLPNELESGPMQRISEEGA